MKLHLGCGRRILKGWFNVDAQDWSTASERQNMIADLRAIPLADASADEILAVHVFEHFYEWETHEVLREWTRLLRPGGTLTLELPDIVKCAQNILDGRPGRSHPDQLTMWGVFGDPRARDKLMCHHWGWSPQTLTARLEEYGFRDIKEEVPQFHSVGKLYRDMRLVARRPH